MAIDARISIGLPTHPKTKKLIKRLGQAAAWNFVCLVLWTASNRSDGNLAGMSVEDIELAADWAGEDGAFVAALVDVRFLDDEENGFVLHDWHEHNPWAAGADMRSAKARWNAAKRHHGAAEADRLVPEYAAIRIATSSASSTDAAEVQQPSSTAPSPSPSPSPSPNDKDKAQAPLPDWVPVDSWTGYVEMRKKIRKPMTARAMALVLGKLESMRATGSDPAAVLDQSTANSWVDVYAPQTSATTKPPAKTGDIDAYCAAHRAATWWAEAGFANVYEATSSKCFHHNAAQFRDGKRLEMA